jgi:hypothetical protein
MRPGPAGDAGQEADAKRRLVGGVPEDADEAVVRRGDLAEEALAGRGQRDAPARAVEQALPELVLERSQALADARLGDAQPLRSAAEVQLVGEGEEDADLAELDRLPHR